MPSAEAGRRYRERHPDRARASAKAYYDRNRATINRRRSAYRYGLTLDEYDALLNGAVCAICRTASCSTGKRLAVDHCHVTGKVRGVLCNNCNRAIGLLGDNPDALLAAAAYLRGLAT